MVAYRHRPERLTTGLLGQILGLELPVPDYTTLARRSARLSLATALTKPNGPVTVVIDSSGLKLFGAGEWQLEKHGGKPRRNWRKLHVAVDPDSGDILAAELTTTEDGDAPRSVPCSTKSLVWSAPFWLMVPSRKVA